MRLPPVDDKTDKYRKHDEHSHHTIANPVVVLVEQVTRGTFWKKWKPLMKLTYISPMTQKMREKRSTFRRKLHALCVWLAPAVLLVLPDVVAFVLNQSGLGSSCYSS